MPLLLKQETMAITKTFYNVSTRSTFDAELAAGNIPERAIAFIKDTREVWAQGIFYPCDFAAGILKSAPTTSTLGYVDAYGYSRSFLVGQACIYQDWEQDGGYGVAVLKGVENGLAIWHDTGTYIRRLEEVELVAEQSYVSSQDAVTIAEEARTAAHAARNAVASLEGLADADTAQQELAARVTQIAQNTDDIAALKATLENQLLTVEMTEDGEVNVFTGENNTMFHDGYIEETGDVVLELIY